MNAHTTDEALLASVKKSLAAVSADLEEYKSPYTRLESYLVPKIGAARYSQIKHDLLQSLNAIKDDDCLREELRESFFTVLSRRDAGREAAKTEVMNRFNDNRDVAREISWADIQKNRASAIILDNVRITVARALEQATDLKSAREATEIVFTELRQALDKAANHFGVAIAHVYKTLQIDTANPPEVIQEALSRTLTLRQQHILDEENTVASARFNKQLQKFPASELNRALLEISNYRSEEGVTLVHAYNHHSKDLGLEGRHTERQELSHLLAHLHHHETSDVLSTLSQAIVLVPEISPSQDL